MTKKELAMLISELNAKIDRKIILGKPYKTLASAHRRAVTAYSYAK